MQLHYDNEAATVLLAAVDRRVKSAVLPFYESELKMKKLVSSSTSTSLNLHGALPFQNKSRASTAYAAGARKNMYRVNAPIRGYTRFGYASIKK
jgi:hypothetical protein